MDATTRLDAAVSQLLGALLGRRGAVGRDAPIDDPDGDYWRTLVAESGIAHEIVWCVPEDGLADAWQTDTDDEVDETRDVDASYGLVQRTMEAWAAARQDGGSHLWLVTRGDDWSEPIAEGATVTAIHVLKRGEVKPLWWEGDPTEPDWSTAETFTVTPDRDGGSWPGATVHRSRLVYIPGKRTTPGRSLNGDGYDLSVLAGTTPAVAELERGWRSIGDTLQRRSTPWIKFGPQMGVRAGAQGDQSTAADRLMLRLRALAEGIRRGGLVSLGQNDEMGWASAPLDGLGESIRTLALWVSAQTGIPITRFLGEQAAGLSNADSPGESTYRSMVARLRKMDVEPALLAVYDVLLGPDPTRRIVWPDAVTPSEETRAKTAETYARELASLTTAGVLTPGEARMVWLARTEVDVPGLDEDTIEGIPAESAEPVDMPPSPEPRQDADEPRRLPLTVLSAYRDGLRRHEAGETGDGLEPITVRMARALVEGQRPTREWVRKGAAWWARNGSWADAEQGSKAFAAAKLWGGKPGRAYYEREASRLFGDE